jgi:hypothetical protein
MGSRECLGRGVTAWSHAERKNPFPKRGKEGERGAYLHEQSTDHCNPVQAAVSALDKCLVQGA